MGSASSSSSLRELGEARHQQMKTKRKALERLSRSQISVGGKASKQPRAVLQDLSVNKHAPTATSTNSSGMRRVEKTGKRTSSAAIYRDDAYVSFRPTANVATSSTSMSSKHANQPLALERLPSAASSRQNKKHESPLLAREYNSPDPAQEDPVNVHASGSTQASAHNHRRRSMSQSAESILSVRSNSPASNQQLDKDGSEQVHNQDSASENLGNLDREECRGKKDHHQKPSPTHKTASRVYHPPQSSSAATSQKRISSEVRTSANKHQPHVHAPKHPSHSARTKETQEKTSLRQKTHMTSTSSTKHSSKTSSSSRYPVVKRPSRLDQIRNVLPDGVDDIDQYRGNDPAYAPEYAKDVHKFLTQLQGKHSVGHDFMALIQGGRHPITPHKRAMLIDWLIDVNENFLFSSDTLYLCVRYVDLFLSRKRISHEHLQLLGIACYHLAVKFQECVKPDLHGLLKLADDAYSPKKVFEMEGHVVKVLEFHFMIPTSKMFLRRFQRAARVTQLEKALGNYVLDLSLGSYDLAGYPPSLVAAASVYVARATLYASDSGAVLKEASRDPRLQDDNDLWHAQLRYYCGFSLEQIAGVVRKLHELHLLANSAQLDAVFRKHSRECFCFVASTVPAYKGMCMPKVTEKTVILSSSLSEMPTGLFDSASTRAATEPRRRRPLAEMNPARAAARRSLH